MAPFIWPAASQEILHQAQHTSLHLFTFVFDSGKGEGQQAFMQPHAVNRPYTKINTTPYTFTLCI